MSKQTQLADRILSEDALKHIYKCEQDGRRPTLESLAGVLQVSPDEVSMLVTKMAHHRLIQIEGNTFHLTTGGCAYALQIIRAHRLWEHYLAEETGFDEAEWHARAERREHHLTPEEVDALSAQLSHPTYDPHGDPIPTPQGEIEPEAGLPLSTLKPGQLVRIVHLEDEPPIVFAQLMAENLHPGLALELTETTPQRIGFRAGGREHTLAPILAANVFVFPLTEKQISEMQPTEPLAGLSPGQRGRVVSLSPACRGAERRRLMDLGIVPGTVIGAELRSPGGDPTAYDIRGALIALRREQAALINIVRLEEVGV